MTQPTPQAPNSATANHPATQALTTPAVTAGEVCATQASPALPFGEFVVDGPELFVIGALAVFVAGLLTLFLRLTRPSR